MTSEFGGGGSPVANVAFLKQAGYTAEMVRLRDYGIHGNGNLMLLEKNNHEVFGVIRNWLDRNVAPHSTRLESILTVICIRQSSQSQDSRGDEF